MTHDSPSSAAPSAPTVLDEIERRLVMALQEGLPLFIRPFSVLASRVGCGENDVLERAFAMVRRGRDQTFRRGCHPDRQTLAAQGDALLVLVPDADVVRLGTCSPGSPGVSSVTNVARAAGVAVQPVLRFAVLITTRFGGTLPICDSASNSRIASDILFALSRTANSGLISGYAGRWFKMCISSLFGFDPGS